MKKLILMTGVKRSGKDTAGAYLCSFKDYQSVTLADPMKELSKDLFEWTEEHTNGELKEIIDGKMGFSPREWLQWFGTQVMQFKISRKFKLFSRIHGRTFWCWKAKRTIDHMDYDKIVITDCRFPHEVAYFRKHFDVTVIRIERFKKPTWFQKLFWHVSEKSILKIVPDFTIKNDKDLVALYNQINAVV